MKTWKFIFKLVFKRNKFSQNYQDYLKFSEIVDFAIRNLPRQIQFTFLQNFMKMELDKAPHDVSH